MPTRSGWDVAALATLLVATACDGERLRGVSVDSDDPTATGPSVGAGPLDGGGSTAESGASGALAATGQGGAAAVAASTGAGAGTPGDCAGSELLGALGVEHVMVGASLTDELAAVTALDLRYVYLSGALPDGEGPCAACDVGCTAQGASCANDSAGGCAWWGCWQSDQQAPGAYVRDFAETARARGQIPMITYYLLLQSSGVGEGLAEIGAVNDPSYLARYLADFRLVLESLGDGPALVHVEPDFWGYAQQANPDPHAIPAAVPSANPQDCGAQEPTLAGLGRCLVAMARIHAPTVKIGLHGSAWATGVDVLQNTDPELNLAAHASAVGGFLAAIAPDADLVFVDASDRDAGYYASIGREAFWDETNTTLPDFAQAFAWSRGVSDAMSRPHLWWQLPYGNPMLSGEPAQWNDNRVDYYLSHMDEVAAARGVGVAFGAGAEGQVTAESDGGHFVALANAYAESGGQPACVD